MSAAGPPPAADPVLWASDRPRPDRPALVSGLIGWGLLAGDGEFSWNREMRGAPYDWAGVYAHGLRLTGPWRVRFDPGGEPFGLPTTLRRFRVRRSRVESEHLGAGLELLQTVCVPPDRPGLLREFVIGNPGPEPRALRVMTEFVPQLAPVLIEGLVPLEHEIVPDRGGPRIRALGSSLRLFTDPAPRGFSVDGRPWAGESFEGRFARVGAEIELTVPARGRAVVRLALEGGLDSILGGPGGAAPEPFPIPPGRSAAAEAAQVGWTAATPILTFPDAPALERGYELARGALRALYSHPAPGFQGLRAGYPWYADTWGRDLAWMLPALFWMNDAAWVDGSIRSFLDYQAPARLPLLAAEEGELPMQLTPGPFFLYGTSDTTLYFVDRLDRYFRHVGADPERLRSLERPLERLRRYREAKTDPSTGLLLNGGETDALQAAGAGTDRVRLGIESPDQTIWDSVDRRDHAIDLQVLGVRALLAEAGFLERQGRAAEARESRSRAAALTRRIAHDYAWPEEGYLYDALRRDGSPVRHLRPNALLAVAERLLPPPMARGVVARARRGDLTTPWGLRTLSNGDPGYRPGAYHDGQVWSIATAWAAAAALVTGQAEAGVGYLGTLAARYEAEGGLANECYRGDAPEPWNSCILLGFSVAPFLTTLFEALWGLTPEMEQDRLRLEPAFPAGWRSAGLTNLRLADGTFSARFSEGSLEVEWSGPRPLTVLNGSESTEVARGARRRIGLAHTS
ncbi:MAG: amylo-alpha-1,6-glucosidase [Thermoplasmata archaeon]